MRVVAEDLAFHLPGAGYVVSEIILPSCANDAEDARNPGRARRSTIRDMIFIRLRPEFSEKVGRSCSLKAKTNAAWASHPSRIVIADILTATFRRGRKIIAQLHSEKCPAAMLT